MLPSRPLRIGIHGATGRMGTRLLSLIAADPTLALGSAVTRAGHPSLGRVAGEAAGLPEPGVPLTSVLGGDLDAVIDFSNPAAALAVAEVCVSRRLPLVVGTTGFEPGRKAELEAAARSIPLMVAANLSRAVNLLIRLVGEAARALGPGVDVEIVERHHRLKRDAPSGTALRLAEEIARASGGGRLVHGRHGLVGERPSGEIGLHALRTGDNPGEHTVVFGLMGECLELSHRALNRDGFARGALDAARFLIDKPPGLYQVGDMIE